MFCCESICANCDNFYNACSTHIGPSINKLAEGERESF